jgi:hypothetical protein
MATWRIVGYPKVWPRICSAERWGNTGILSYSGLVSGGKCGHLLGNLGRVKKRGVEGRIGWGRERRETRLLLLALLLRAHLLVGILGSTERGDMSGSADTDTKTTVLLHYVQDLTKGGTPFQIQQNNCNRHTLLNKHLLHLFLFFFQSHV